MQAAWDAATIPVSIRLDGSVLADLRSEAERLGIPYQTMISSVLYIQYNECKRMVGINCLWPGNPAVQASQQVLIADVTVNPAVEQPAKPSFIQRPPELATPELASAEAPRLPVMRRMRPRAPISPEPPRVEWITAEIATDFYTIPCVEAFGPNDRVRVVRIQVPSSMLADFGLPVYSDLALRPVLADVMVGDGNVARSIRFIQQWRLPRDNPIL